MSGLKGKKVLVGLTGGIACYKVPYLVRFLRKQDVEVQVVMTEAATKFITPLTLETVSDRPVATELFPANKFISTRHIDMGEWPDLVVIAPATANFLGKVASGVSDDLLTTIVCATARPVMIAPAMNPQMWSNKITQKNCKTLREVGYRFVDPAEGNMACDHFGVGRMAEPEQIFEAIKAFFSEGSKKKVLTGKKILVTAGPTREAVDPVRYLTNHSSGKMGFALAQAALQLGAEVTLISGPTNLDPPQDVRFLQITSTDELHQAVDMEFPGADCLIMAAAPADFRPAKVASQKVKKHEAGLTLALEPTVDILREVSGKKKDGQIVVGFALETENGLENAKAKLAKKNLDMIVLNQPGEKTGFEHDTNKVTLIMREGNPIDLPLESKLDLALSILHYVSSLL